MESRPTNILNEQLLSAEDAWAALLERAIVFIPKLIVAIVLFLLTLWLAGLLARLTRGALADRKVDESLRLLAYRFVKWTVIVVGTIVSLDQVDFDVTTFIAGLGVAGIALGFAFQDIGENFISGVLMLLTRPVDIGDRVTVAEFTGEVKDIDLRSTELLTPDGLTVILPNKEVFTNAMVNFDDTPTRRVDLDVGVAYDTDLETARRVALDTVTELDDVLDDPAPRLLFHTFGGSSIDFRIEIWTSTKQGVWLDVRDRAVVAIKSAFEDAGIEIPYPIRTIIMTPTGEDQ